VVEIEEVVRKAWQEMEGPRGLSSGRGLQFIEGKNPTREVAVKGGKDHKRLRD